MKFKKKTFFLKVIIIFLLIMKGISQENLDFSKKSGYFFAEPSTRDIQDDDFLNPGFLWVEIGKNLWNTKSFFNEKGLSCASCHNSPENMRGVSLKYPKVFNKKTN